MANHGKKPPGRAVDPRNGSRLTLVPPNHREKPEPPSGLLKPSVERWDAYWDDVVSGLCNPGDMGLLIRWITNVDEWHRAMKEFKKQRIVRGSTGQPTLNPLAGYIASREAAIEKAEDRLGLSPLARMKLGVALGEANKSLDEMNASLTQGDADEDNDDDYDPRVIEGTTG